MAVFISVWIWNRSLERRQGMADFDWFTGLGFPDVRGYPYVRVATGWTSQTGNNPPQNRYFNGFLLGTNREEFRVIGLDLSVRTSTQTVAGTSESKRVGFDRLDLRREASGIWALNCLA